MRDSHRTDMKQVRTRAALSDSDWFDRYIAWRAATVRQGFRTRAALEFKLKLR